MNYTNEKYACEDINWLGLLPSDLFQFNLDSKVLMKTSPDELKKCQQLLTQYKSFFEIVKPRWGQELRSMLERGTKAELQALTAESFTYFSASYLPYKIENGLFIWRVDLFLASQSDARYQRLELNVKLIDSL